MPLYAGVCETDITPPPGCWMSGYAGRQQESVGVHDPLYARALVLENGLQRVALVSADLIAFPYEMVTRICAAVAATTNIPPQALMLHATHTHGGPCIGTFRSMGEIDASYNDILIRKIVGAVRQAANSLQPAHLTYGEASAQIGVNRRQTLPDGKTVLGTNYGGPVVPTVQALCVNRADGRTFALLFSHACHPTTLGGENLHITADWPGAATAHLKARFRREGADTGVTEDALPFFLQGCLGDISPLQRGSWEAMEANGKAIAEAAHAARWNAHGRLNESLEFAEVSLSLPMLRPSLQEVNAILEEYRALQSSEQNQRENNASHVPLSHFQAGRLAWATAALPFATEPTCTATQDFTIQKLTLGGLQILGFPAEMFAQYHRDFVRQSSDPLMTLSCTNGCWNYLPTAAEYARGGYEVESAFQYYGTLMFAPESEALIRETVGSLLGH